MDNNLSMIINLKNSNFLSDIYVINVLLDKVITYTNNSGIIELADEQPFFNFMQKISPNIHKDDLNKYFNYLTINKLKDSGGSLSYSYKYKNSDNSYSTRINLVRSDNNIIYVYVLKDKFNLSNDIVKNDKSNVELNALSTSVVNTIIKIYNAIDTTLKDNSTGKYITNLLDDLINQFSTLESEFKKNMTLQVNKIKDVIIIIDDDSITRTLIKKTFNNKYDIVEFKNGEEAIKFFSENTLENIAGVFLDLFMPVLDGFAVLEYFKSNSILGMIPVVIISGAEDKETRQKVYQYNIADLLSKPFNLDIIRHRVDNLVRLYKNGNSLNNMVYSQYNDLISIVEKINDSYLYDNKIKLERIQKYAKFLLLKIDELYPEYNLTTYTINKCLDAIKLYDIGYFTLPKTIGLSGKYTDYELELLKNYSKLNESIFHLILQKSNDLDLEKICCTLSNYSHELFDGSGFPKGIKGDEIPIISQCVQMATSLDYFIIRNDDNIQKQNNIKNYFNSNKYNPKLVKILIDNLVQIIKL